MEQIGRRSMLTGAAVAGVATAGAVLGSALPAAAAAVGPWEYVAPGSSIQTAITGGAKAIQLGAGTYNVTSAIVLQRAVSIRGVGQSTRIVCTASPTISEVITISGAIDGVYLGDFVIDVAGKANVGINLDINGTSGNYQGEPDAVCRLDNLWIYSPVQDGIVYQGTDTQATVTTRVRVRQAGRYGYNILAPDNMFIGCEATTASGGQSGFYVGSANCQYHSCKAWYCRGYGWHVKGTRNAFIGCESQDTKLHGWYIEYDKNAFVGCVADTAGMYDVGGTSGTADGFYVDPGVRTTMSGCLAFDRKPGGHAAQQRYGFNILTALQSGGLFVANTGWDNATGLVNLR